MGTRLDVFRRLYVRTPWRFFALLATDITSARVRDTPPAVEDIDVRRAAAAPTLFRLENTATGRRPRLGVAAALEVLAVAPRVNPPKRAAPLRMPEKPIIGRRTVLRAAAWSLTQSTSSSLEPSESLLSCAGALALRLLPLPPGAEFSFFVVAARRRELFLASSWARPVGFRTGATVLRAAPRRLVGLATGQSSSSASNSSNRLSSDMVGEQELHPAYVRAAIGRSADCQRPKPLGATTHKWYGHEVSQTLVNGARQNCHQKIVVKVYIR